MDSYKEYNSNNRRYNGWVEIDIVIFFSIIGIIYRLPQEN